MQLLMLTGVTPVIFLQNKIPRVIFIKRLRCSDNSTENHPSRNAIVATIYNTALIQERVAALASD
jgi:hypothetical protein